MVYEVEAVIPHDDTLPVRYFITDDMGQRVGDEEGPYVVYSAHEAGQLALELGEQEARRLMGDHSVESMRTFDRDGIYR